MVVLRRVLGDELRRIRTSQGRTLRDVSATARVSLGYLSEVERGHKEPSSELLAAICTALETPLSSVLINVGTEIAVLESASAPVPLHSRDASVAGSSASDTVVVAA